MQARIIHQDAPTIAPEIKADLLAMDPAVHMLWNPRYKLEANGTSWEPRWEIWVQLQVSQHPDATNQVFDTDIWNTDAQCWMRKLQTYHTEDRKFAAADRALVIGLQMADAWASRTFYEEMIERPYDDKQERQTADQRDMLGEAAKYHYGVTNPIVGRHVNSGWRWRIN